MNPPPPPPPTSPAQEIAEQSSVSHQWFHIQPPPPGKPFILEILGCPVLKPLKRLSFWDFSYFFLSFLSV